MASTEAQKAKDRGNAAFKAGNFPDAVGHYTAAILADRKDPTYPLNRAAAYLKLGKNQDAERDCSTVLRLNPANVKALYRRGQARIELERLNEAEADLNAALKVEPNNDAVKLELTKVKDLLQKAKKNSPRTLAAESTVPKRRRVPIEIVESSSSIGPSPAVPSTSSSALLSPISSRSLAEKPAESSSLYNAPSRVSDTLVSISPAAPGATSRGGIFRHSGQHTLFNHPAERSHIPSEGAYVIQSSPISLFEFSRSWEQASSSERWELICRIPPSAIPSLFKNSLETSLLISIVEALSLAVSSNSDSYIKNLVREYLTWFPKVTRFATVTMFISKQERELCRMLLNTVGGVNGWKL